MAETAIATGTAKDLVFMLARIEDEKIYDVVPHRQKRSLNQNAYYWQLLSKVADKLRISKSKLHNDMLRHFGQRMEVDGKPVVVYLPDTEEAENTAMESDTVHLKQTSSTLEGNNGITYRAYVMMRGSHDYSVAEMTVLVDGIVQEARQLDIETLTYAELEHMRELERQAETMKNGKAQADKGN